MKTTIQNLVMFAGVLALAIASGCSDSPPEGSGSNGGAGPAGPGVGPGPTSTGTQAGPSSGPGTGGTGATGMGGMGGTGGMGDCFMNPMTHVEIINACTTAEAVDKPEAVGIWDEGDALPPLP